MTTILVRYAQRAAQCLGRLRADNSGNVAVIFALSAVVLMLAIGGAVDIGRWLHARDQTLAAVDAAVLAGGRALQTKGSDTAGAIAAAQKYYTQNVTSRLPVTNDTVTFTVASDGMGITAKGSAYIKTPFLQLANISQLPLISTGQTDFARSQIAVGGNGGESIEVAMMLDVTGSMAGQKLIDLKDAAKDLINIVVWADQSKYTSKVAIVPFSEDIRLPTTTALTKARGSPATSKKVGSTTYYLSDCVVERIGTQKYTDAEPASGAYIMGHYTKNSTGSGSSKKGVCTIPAGAEVMPLSSDTTSLLAKVNGLSAAGGTAGHLGTAWAWYTLSPNWSSLWSSANQPQAYGTANLSKIAILMTDGEYNSQYDSNGISVNQNSTTCSSAANGCSTAQARALCTAMKAQSIKVYTVGFAIGGSTTTAYQTLSQCATDSTKFYNAADGEQLKQAFRDIALKLSSLYISK